MNNKYIDLERIEFFITNKCSSKCKHCSVQNKKSSQNHIEEGIAVDIIKKLSTNYNIKSIMTFGGEPLLFPNEVIAIHKVAKEVGIPYRQIITNGYWTKDFNIIEKISHKLAEAGVNKILISVDAFHQEYIPLELVKKVANSLLEAGISDIKWSPCWAVSEDDNNQYNKKTKSILEELEEIPIETGNGNVLYPEGAALENLRDYLPSKKCLTKGKCGDEPYTEPLDLIKSISIEPNGDVAVCKDFKIGNVNEKSISEIIEDYNPYNNLYMKTILEEGVEGLLNMVKNRGLNVDSNEFYSICDMCTKLRRKLK